MNQNPTVDNDLQKAIDDITNTTNSDPVFADPVAAPSSVPEGDNGELAESVGPFPAPEPMPEPAPEMMAEPMPAPMPVPMPNMPQPSLSFPDEPTTDLNTAITDFSLPSAEAPAPVEEAVAGTTTFEAPVAEPAVANLSIREIKTAALHDLAPLVNKLDMSPSQKFNIYRNMFENLRDYTVIELAYQAAKNIMDERERAEALLYLVEAIDKM